MDERSAGAYYPMMVDLTDRRCLVVGGGRIAERKIESLLAAQAAVAVISPDMTARIQGWAAEGKLIAERRLYQPGDTAGAFLVFAASGDATVNDRVCADAKAAGCLVSSADHAENGNFIVPAVVSQGRLQLSVSTSGASPALAKSLAAALRERYGPEYAVYLDFLDEFRLNVKRFVNNAEHRHALNREIITIDWLDKIRGGEFASLKDELLRELALEQGAFTLERWVQIGTAWRKSECEK